ncbi:MAG: sigma-70 family RNA polymerase sigma factor [Candidatus Cloacimonas sp.]|nr:sigma-70 family RNA polymerase sigma factor [Candidatus Cloacimonas sp.]
MNYSQTDKLITQYSNFAYSVARIYRNKGLDWEDLKQESLIGLLKASQHYDPGKNVKFTTYASYWIKKQICEALKKDTRHLEEELHENIPTDNNIDQNPDYSNYNLNVRKENTEYPQFSFNFPSDMPSIEINILTLSFQENQTLKEIAELMSISVERVKQHKKKALRRLKKHLQ